MNRASWDLPEILDYLGYGSGGARDHPDEIRPGAIHRAEVCRSRDCAHRHPAADYYWRLLRMMMPGQLLPDITVYWEQSFPWSALYSPRFGTVELCNQDVRTGSHAAHAFILASGEGIPKGATISGASIFDLVPTILYGAGMRAPTTCEGRPLFPALCAPA